MRHVNPDLMGTSGFQPAFYIGEFVRARQNIIMGNRIFSAPGKDCHFLSVGRMASNQCMDSPLLLLYHAVNDGVVSAHNGVVF